MDDSPCVRATVKPQELVTVNPLTLAFSGCYMSLPLSLAHTYKCAHKRTRTHTHKHHPPPWYIFLIVARQRLEKVSAAPLDIDSAIVIISSFPFLPSNINNSLSPSLKPSIHLPYVGPAMGAPSRTTVYTQTHTARPTHEHTHEKANIAGTQTQSRHIDVYTHTHTWRHTHPTRLSGCQQSSLAR